MPVIPQPIAARYDRRSQVTRLYFDTIGGKQVQRFYVKGSVSWPEGSRDGFAIVAGQNLDDHRILPFREFRFRTVEHWITPGGQLVQHGFIKFMAEAWLDFACRSFFFSQDEETHRRYSLECYDSDMVEPKPEFIRVLYANQDIGDNVIEEVLALRQLSLDANSELARQLSDYRTHRNADPGKTFINEGTHALRCLLAGFVYNPLPPPPRDRGMTELEWEPRRR